jgi:Chaperone of endosialidase
MGGQTSTTQTTQQQSQTAPWKPTQPYLQQALQQLGPALGNTGTSAGENSAIEQLVGNARDMPNFGAPAGNLASQLLDGTYRVNPNSTVGQSYNTLKAQVAPYAAPGYANPYNNPAFQNYLDVTTRDIANRVNSMFAGAGRDLSGINQQALARGITEGTAPTFANEYNTLAGQQMDAAKTLFGAGLGASAAGVGNAQTGLGVAGALPQLENQNAQSLLQAYAQRYGLPLSKLSQAESLLLPIAQLGSQSQGTGSSTTVQEANPINQLLSAAAIAASIYKNSDRRLKRDITQIGALNDGTPVYRFRYIDSPKVHIGLMADEVEQFAPQAVIELGGFKLVDYGRATDRAAGAA